MRDHYKQKIIEQKEDILPIDQYISKELETIVSELPDVILNKDKVHIKAKVVHVVIAHSNEKIIENLKRRGRQIIKGKFARANKVTEKNKKLIEESIAEIGIPVKAFVTFADQEHHDKC